MIGLAEKETTAMAVKDSNRPMTVKCRNCTEDIARESVKIGWGDFPFCSDTCVGTFENSILKA